MKVSVSVNFNISRKPIGLAVSVLYSNDELGIYGDGTAMLYRKDSVMGMNKFKRQVIYRINNPHVIQEDLERITRDIIERNETKQDDDILKDLEVLIKDKNVQFEMEIEEGK